MDIDKLLARINYTGPREVSLPVLRGLKHAFLYNVPFENLDIHAHVPISLEPEQFYNKIVTRHRGGFCYECNGIFHDLLQLLGFRVQIVSAMMTYGKIHSSRYSHMVLLVHLDRPYLTDVGNGQSVQEPMAVPGDEVSHAEGIEYRVGPYGDDEYALYYRRPGEGWTSRFVFTTTPRSLHDFESMCRYHQTSPESPFMKQRLCTLPLDHGRATLAGDTLTLHNNGHEVLKITADTPAEVRELLQKYFKITLQIADLY